MGTGHTWALVLAAGEGSRLRSLTTSGNGVPVPKQFCSLQGGPSLLQEALTRAASVAKTSRICAIVAAQHRCWWEGQLWSLPAQNVIVQPENRGTANGILLPLLHIAARDPDARVVLLPSDHHVRDEATLARSLKEAVRQTAARPDQILLLGVKPEEADSELGYIVPLSADGDGAYTVEEFAEKPSLTLARQLIERGAMWNVFILAGAVRSFIQLFERCYPEITREMRSVARRDLLSPGDGFAATDLYERLPDLDFSRDVLEGKEALLRMLAVPNCGWSDLGTPRRVAETLRRLPRDAARIPGELFGSAHINLAVQHERLQFAT